MEERYTLFGARFLLGITDELTCPDVLKKGEAS